MAEAKAYIMIPHCTKDTIQYEMDELVRCRDCKHRPIMPKDHTDGFDLKFPDNKCPCQCDDGFYSWYPADNWFCADGERRTDDA